MQRLRVDGVELSVLALEAQAAPVSTVVMLHGLVLGSMATWYSGYALPLTQRHRVLLYDLRGHGDSSPAVSGYDLDTLASDLAGVLAAHAPHARVDLVGHSVGALVALHFALRHPRHVRRLVLVDAPMPASEYVAPGFAGVTDATAIAAFLDAHAATLAPRRRARLQERLQRLCFGSSMIADIARMHAEPLAELRRMHAPALLIYGDASPCRAAGETLRDALPDARLEIVAGGHYLPEEAPQALLAAIRDFLAEPDTP